MSRFNARTEVSVLTDSTGQVRGGFVMNPGTGPVDAVDAREAIKNVQALVRDILAVGNHVVGVEQLAQPVWSISPCAACGSTDPDKSSRPGDCCWPVSDRRVAGKGEGAEQPTEIETQMMMGGNKYEAEHDGRFPFRVTIDGTDHLVEMPSLSLDEVRFTGTEDQNIWDFPRLFVDGSSWVWKYAVADLLTPEEKS